MDTRFETTYGYTAGKYEWLTPPGLIKALGPFDLDPCYSKPRPWKIASIQYGIEENGLIQTWRGFAWCNPPYGNETAKWLEKMAGYKHCLGLIFARTETKMFHKFIWDQARAVFFFKGRIKFFNTDGTEGKMSAGAPSCLVAWDSLGVLRLQRLTGQGKLIFIKGEKS